jgi:hypothetical protein
MADASGEFLLYTEGENEMSFYQTRKEVPKMLFNSYLLQRLREERVKDALRNAEQARLIQAAKGAGVADQAASRGLLIKVWDLGLSLVSVHRIEPDVPVPQQG